MSVPLVNPFPAFSVCPPAKVNAPPYIVMHKGHPRMNFGVLNRSSLISSELLTQVLKAIRIQTKKDFAPYYGIDAVFTVFTDTTQPDWTKYVPLIFVDKLLSDVNEVGILGFHDIQAPPSGQGGDPIDVWISNPPTLPNGLPYAIIPMGNNELGYGVYWDFLQSFPGDPPTFAGVLASTTSHEVLEVLGDATNNAYITDFGTANTLTQFELNQMEVCDPVEFGPSYPSPVNSDLYMSNFVLPSYWNPYGQTLGPFDFLHRVRAPLTPFQGEQNVILITHKCVVTQATKISYVDGPTNIILQLGTPVFSSLNRDTNTPAISTQSRRSIHRRVR